MLARFGVLMATAVALFTSAACVPASGQEFQTVIRAQGRAFPGINGNVSAMKRDDAGRYYVLTKTANVVWILDSDGNRVVDQIPNAHSGGAVIKYAVDVDISRSGDIFVADRGANAVDIFRADGSLVARIPVFAPVSLAALPDGQFAVVTLRPHRLVSILNEQGKEVLSFGDFAELDIESPPRGLINLGKIAEDPAGHIYFAFTSLPHPLIRKYDRFGYAAYSASIQGSQFQFSPTTHRDRIEFSLNFMRMNLSNQFHGSLTVGSSGSVQFGAGIGMGLGARMGGGPMMGLGSTGGTSSFSGPPGPGGMSSVGMSGQGSLRTGAFHFHLGLGPSAIGGEGPGGGPGGPGDAAEGDSGPGADGSQGSLLSSILRFTSPGSSDNAAYGMQSPSLDQGLFSGALQATNGGYGATGIVGGMGGISGIPGGAGGMAGGMGFGAPGGELSTGMPGDMTFQPAMFAGNTLGFATQRPQFSVANLNSQGSQAARFSASGGMFGGGSRASGTSPGTGFATPGHFGFAMADVVGTVRINLDHDRAPADEKPMITAIGVDPEREEVWAAIGNTLLEFDKDGQELRTYYVTTPEGMPLRPNALIIERNRILVSSDSLGVFSFEPPHYILQPPIQPGVSGQVVPPRPQ